MKKVNNDIIAIYMLSAYSSNMLDLIDNFEKRNKGLFKHEIKKACRMFYKAMESNKLLQELLNELFKVDSLEYNQFRDEVDKTIETILTHSPREFVRLKYARKIIEDDSAFLFTEDEMKEFAIQYRVSKSLSVSDDLIQFIKSKAHFIEEAHTVKNSKLKTDDEY